MKDINVTLCKWVGGYAPINISYFFSVCSAKKSFVIFYGEDKRISMKTIKLKADGCCWVRDHNGNSWEITKEGLVLDYDLHKIWSL